MILLKFDDMPLVKHVDTVYHVIVYLVVNQFNHCTTLKYLELE